MVQDPGPIMVIEAGVVEHAAVDDAMRRLQSLRIEGRIPDALILVEHPEVVTRGPRARRDGIAVDPDYPLRDVDRGGGITYHGPGQAVAYPIVGWRGEEQSVPKVIDLLEAWVIDALASLGIESGRDERMQGVWIDGAKVASIGLSFRHWVSRHGLSINIDTAPGRVESLHGCGLDPGTTTSLHALGRTVDADGATLDRSRVEEALLDRMGTSLGRVVEERIPWHEMLLRLD